MNKIGFIGCGNIATAIFGGGIASGVLKAEDIICFDLDGEKSAAFALKGAVAYGDVAEVAALSDILFLTVKPQVFPAVIEGIKEYVKRDALIVTPAAGIKISRVKELFGFDIKTVRVMPNTPLMYSAGATAVASSREVAKNELNFVKKIFASSGIIAEVSEDLMDAVTGISGSSPAFFMRFAMEIINSGVKEGLSEAEAKALVIGTMLGTAKMVIESDKSIGELISAVASPNGTTEAGLKAMDRLEFDKITAEIINAAITRSKELSQ